ncbi:MAG: hypothetical protein ABJO45_04695 [Lentilitoribacter sp.]
MDKAVTADEVLQARPFPDVRLKALGPLLKSFIILVLLPALLALFYYVVLAAPVYEGNARVAVRKDTSVPGNDIGVALGSSTALATFSDSFIVTSYAKSREMVEQMQARVDLVSAFSKGGADPFYQLADKPSIEELTSYWERMVDAAFDASTGIIEVNVRAFNPDDVLLVSNAMIDILTELVKTLSEKSRTEAVSFAAESVQHALLTLELNRTAINRFRTNNQTSDPRVEVENLNGQISILAQEVVQLTTERSVKRRLSPNNNSADQQLSIEIKERNDEINRIKQSLNEYGPNKVRLPLLLREYETLVSNLTISHEQYQKALDHLGSANAVAALRSAHLFVFVEIRKPEQPSFPNLPLDFLQVLFVLFGIWGIYRMFA